MPEPIITEIETLRACIASARAAMEMIAKNTAPPQNSPAWTIKFIHSIAKAAGADLDEACLQLAEKRRAE